MVSRQPPTLIQGPQRNPDPIDYQTTEFKNVDLEIEAASPPAQRIVIIDDFCVVGLSEEDEAFYRGFSPAQRRKVRNKVDLRLMPALSILYLFAQLDRANIGNAKIEGMKQDMHLTDHQYNIVVAVFFIPYLLLEVPSNMILKGLKRPSIYLGALVLSWGVVMTCHGFAQDFKSMLVMRLLLGVTEAGFYPGTLYLCSQWYRPHELAFRLALFTAISSAAGVISGLLAAAIAKMDGIGGYEGWRWIFLVEGGITVVLGLLTYWFLVDTPSQSASWLESDEIRYLNVQSLIKQGGASDDDNGNECSPTLTWQDLLAVMADWRYWAFGFLFHTVSSCGYGLKLTAPTIVRGLGYSTTHSQILSSVPYIFGVVSCLAAAYLSDFFKSRSVFVASGCLLIMAGFGTIMALLPNRKDNKAGIIVGMSLVTSGVYPIAPTAGSWVSNNIALSSRRAIGLAFVMALGSIGGLTGSFIYVEEQAPSFPLGFKVSCALAGAGFVVSLILTVSYWLENRKRALMSEAEIMSTYSEKELRKMGEKSPLFQYTL